MTVCRLAMATEPAGTAVRGVARRGRSRRASCTPI
ncbi:Uncharacterised protein [Bordetella pertussis]|nr:Uncharacterised protein [Bordetella pertussis]